LELGVIVVVVIVVVVVIRLVSLWEITKAVAVRDAKVSSLLLVANCSIPSGHFFFHY